MLEHELRQASVNDLHYRNALTRVAECRDAGIDLSDDQVAMVRLKTAMTRMANQAKRIGYIPEEDPDWELYSAMRAQAITRTRELLEIWEPVERTLRRREVEARRAAAVQGLRWRKKTPRQTV